MSKEALGNYEEPLGRLPSMEGACNAWLCGISNSITEGAYSKCLCKPTFRCGQVLKWLGPSYYNLLIIHNNSHVYKNCMRGDNNNVMIMNL